MNAHGRIFGVARETALTPANPSRQPAKPDRRHETRHRTTSRPRAFKPIYERFFEDRTSVPVQGRGVARRRTHAGRRCSQVGSCRGRSHDDGRSVQPHGTGRGDAEGAPGVGDRVSSFRGSSRPPAPTRSIKSNGSCATRLSAGKRARSSSSNARSRCPSPGRSRRPTSSSRSISAVTSARRIASGRSSS